MMVVIVVVALLRNELASRCRSGVHTVHQEPCGRCMARAWPGVAEIGWFHEGRFLVNLEKLFSATSASIARLLCLLMLKICCVFTIVEVAIGHRYQIQKDHSWHVTLRHTTTNVR